METSVGTGFWQRLPSRQRLRFRHLFGRYIPRPVVALGTPQDPIKDKGSRASFIFGLYSVSGIIPALPSGLISHRSPLTAALLSLSLAELIRLLPPPAAATPALPTGIVSLDAALLGGGLPRGRLTELVGSTGSGKTTLARAIVEATVSSHGWVAYIDATRTLDARDWVHLGDAEGMWMIRPLDATRAAWCADVLLRSGAFALVVLDGAPLLTRAVAVRLTRLARESNAAFVVMGDRIGGATQLGGAVRLVAERRRSSTRQSDRKETTHTIGVRVEKGGTLRTVEVSCAIAVARRLCTHPEVPDRRGVARGPGLRHGRKGRAASPPPHSANAPIVIDPPPSRELRAAVEHARALG